MGFVIDELLKLGKNQIGYAENPLGSNRTKYGVFSDTPKAKNGPYPWYNGKKNGECGWCCLGINWEYMMVLMPLLGSYDKVRSYLGYPKPSENTAAGAPHMRDFLVAKFGKVAKNQGVAGDVIFLNTKLGKCGHVGRIYEVKDGKYKTIEYNKGDHVAWGSYSINSTNIHTIVHIDFSDIEPKEETPNNDAVTDPKPIENPVADLKPEPISPEPSVEPSKSIDQLAKEVIDGKWGNGKERAQRLTEAGYSYQAVQDRVNEMLGIKKPASSSSPAPAPSPAGQKYIVSLSDPKSYLRIRCGAGYNYPEIGKLKKDEEVIVLETKNGFGRIGTGKWASMGFLKKA